MIDNNNLIEMNYLKSEYFDRSERLLARSLWCKVLKQDVERWNNDKYLNIFPRFGRLKLDIFYNLMKFASRIYNSRSSNKLKVMWISDIANNDFLYRSQPYNLIVSDARMSLNSLKKLISNNNICLQPIYSCYSSLYSGIINGDESLLQEGLSDLENIFNGVNPDLITVHDDIFPINRAIILVARELNIPTVEIQHGIYMSHNPPKGRQVDYTFVWGEYFKDMYVKNKIKPADKIRILGYPYEIKKYGNVVRERKLVTYLGQNFEVINKDLLSTKVETIMDLKRMCDKLDFDFIYRPHPGDDLNSLKSELKTVNFTPKGETLQRTLENGDIFISFNSTTLIEANLGSKLSIQFKSYDMPTDDLEKIGACSKSVETSDELEKYLKNIKNQDLSTFYRPVDEGYIKVPHPDPGKRFLELIEDILKD